jgi:hypothetical protein
MLPRDHKMALRLEWRDHLVPPVILPIGFAESAKLCFLSSQVIISLFSSDLGECCTSC